MRYVAVLLAAAVVFLVVELGMGAWSFGQVKRVDPCTAAAPNLGSGFDATAQRIVLDGLNAAACRLHTTREELVQSLRSGPSRWSDAQLQAAIRAGLVQAIDRAEHRGEVPGILAGLLRQAAKHAPIKFLVENGGSITGLLGQLLGG